MNVICKQVRCYFNSAVLEEDTGFCDRNQALIGEVGCLSFDSTGKYYTVKKRKALKRKEGFKENDL